MSKLRLIKDRTQDVHTEFDLRGMGNDPLITQSFPIGALLIKNIQGKDIGKTAAGFGFSLVHLHDHDSAMLHSSRLVAGEHKHHAIQLFLFSLHLLDQFGENTHFFVSEISRLHLNLENAIKGKNTPIGPLMLEKFNELDKHHHSHQLTVDGATAMHLQQAGFPVRAHAMANVSWNRKELLAVRDELKKELAERNKSMDEQSKRKVG